MATSGSTDFNMTRNEIIQDAFLLIGVLGAEESLDASDQAIAARALNRMIKAWQAQGINIWRYQEGTLFFDTANQAKWTLSSTSIGDDFSDSVVTTTTGADEAAAQTTITVTSSTGMTASDWIGIELDDGTLHETTISSVDDSTTITIASGLASAASSGNEVFTYTTKAARPVRIESIRIRSSDDNDFNLEQLSRDEYFSLPTKDTTSGRPTGWYYDPGRGDTEGGTLYLWPRPDDVTLRAKITYVRTIEDFDSATDNPDLPVEWLDAIVYNLATRLGPMYGKDQKVINTIAPLAQTFLEEAKEFDNETGDFRVVPERRFD